MNMKACRIGELEKRFIIYVLIEGVYEKGFGEGAYYVSLPYYNECFKKLLGCNPYPGTLNVRLTGLNANMFKNMRMYGKCCYVIEPLDLRYGRVFVYEALVYGLIEALVVLPEKSRHGEDVIELVSCVELKKFVERFNGRVYIVIGCRLLERIKEFKRRVSALVSLAKDFMRTCGAAAGI